MILRRHYFQHRHAYAPRFLPLILPVGIFAAGVSMLLSTVFGTVGSIVSVALGLVIGYFSSVIRWAIWRRRHPAQWEVARWQ